MVANPSGPGTFICIHGARLARHLPPLAALALLLLAGLPAQADVTRTDVQVAARALSFVADPLSGTVRVGIVYSDGSARSLREARSLRSILGSGFRMGNLELIPVLIESAAAATADVDLFFLTEYLTEAQTPQLLGDSTGRRILCITTDLEQVRNGACIMGVRSQPKVEVFVNRAAAAASDITFSTVFRVMITEL